MFPELIFSNACRFIPSRIDIDALAKKGVAELGDNWDYGIGCHDVGHTLDFYAKACRDLGIIAYFQGGSQVVYLPAVSTDSPIIKAFGRRRFLSRAHMCDTPGEAKELWERAYYKFAQEAGRVYEAFSDFRGPETKSKGVLE